MPAERVTADTGVRTKVPLEPMGMKESVKLAPCMLWVQIRREFGALDLCAHVRLYYHRENGYRWNFVSPEVEVMSCALDYNTNVVLLRELDSNLDIGCGPCVDGVDWVAVCRAGCSDIGIARVIIIVE